MAGPSAYALKTTSQRAMDYEAARSAGRLLFRPAGGQGHQAFLSPEGALNLANFIRTGNGWFDSNTAASTWVSKYGFWAQGGQGGLAIQFHDGAICWYPTLDYSYYGAMMGAASKGKFIHEYIYKKVGYILVSN